MEIPINGHLGEGSEEKDQFKTDEQAVKLSVNHLVKLLPKTESRRAGRPGRLRDFEIKNRIQAGLSLRPMGLYELSQSIGSTLRTTEKHVEYLYRLGVVQRVEFNDLGKRKILYSKK